MSRFALLLAVFALTGAPAFSEEAKPAPAKKADPLERALAALDGEFQLKEGTNVKEVPLLELLAYLSKQYNLSFVINEEAFKREGITNVRDAKPDVTATQFDGATVRQFLTTALDAVGATYLHKGGLIEIVPGRHAAAMAKVGAREDESGRARLPDPLVTAVFKEKPLNEAVAKVAEMYDLTVIVSPQAADAKAGFVTARLLNVPADKALDLLAVQCDLRVVRKGNAYLVTSRDHANELFNEKAERERQKIELDKLREAPAKPPAPAERAAP